MSEYKFEPTVESLRTHKCPEWFQNAKFGIYLHWGVYSVAERGEWYARQMYIEGDPVYQHHVKTYGHPSKFGYKDLIPLWKAEKFDHNRDSKFKLDGAHLKVDCRKCHKETVVDGKPYITFKPLETACSSCHGGNIPDNGGRKL